MPPVVNPVSDLARIYRQRVPTQAGQPAARSDRFGFGMATRPTGQTSSNPLGAVGRLARTAVESLDPRLILSEGGRSVQHAVGDATELAKSVISGRDTLSQSPTARTYQAAGGGAQGAFAAAMPYVNLASTAAPFVAPARGALLERAVARQTADATEQLARQLAEQSVPRTLADRPIIQMPRRLPDRPIIEMARPMPNEYGLGTLGPDNAVVLMDDTGVTTLTPAPRSPTPPRPTLDLYGDLNPTELAKLRELDLPENVTNRFNRAFSGTSSTPRPNPLQKNMDWSAYDTFDDVDLTRVFNNPNEASIVGGVAAEKYAAQQDFRNQAVQFLRDNKALTNLNYAILPENYVRTNTINDLLMKHPDLQVLYQNIMDRYGF